MQSGSQETRRLKEWFWAWPDGLVWRVTDGPTRRSRARRYSLFVEQIRPTMQSTILDVGVSGGVTRGTDFLEAWHPWPAQITALGTGEWTEFESFQGAYPQVTLVLGDGRELPFPDKSFDVVFSNAVIEHTGTREQQQQFLRECLRVGRRVFLTTPNAGFPIDSHTLIPFAHWLPLSVRDRIYRRAGRSFYADVAHLNLLRESDLLSLLPYGTRYRIIRQRALGMCANLILVTDGESGSR